MYSNYAKRLIDIFLSALAIIIFTPLFIIIAIMIKIDSKGPVFFLQNRLGRDGKVFKIIKFRSMIVGAEIIGEGLRVSSDDDKRITKIGKFLRKTSLDELPQLFNVLSGSMSLVGPRPPATYHPYKFEDYDEEKIKRFIMRPGITGLAQVKVRNSAPWDERIALDVEYVKQVSFLLDLKIMLLTVGKVLLNNNVYGADSAKPFEVIKDVTLRAFTKEDIVKKVAWINDSVNNEYLHYDLPLNVKETQRWWKKAKKRVNRKDYIILFSGKAVGLTGLYNIDKKNSNAELHIILGEKEYKKKGISLLAVKILLKYAFMTLDLNKIYLFVDDKNTIAKNFYQKAGFKLEGVLKEHMLFKKEFIDRCIYGITKNDWREE